MIETTKFRFNVDNDCVDVLHGIKFNKISVKETKKILADENMTADEFKSWVKDNCENYSKEAERIAKEQAKKAERIAKEQAKKAERIAKEKAKVAERIAKEKAKEAERIAKEQAVIEHKNKIKELINNSEYINDIINRTGSCDKKYFKECIRVITAVYDDTLVLEKDDFNSIGMVVDLIKRQQIEEKKKTQAEWMNKLKTDSNGKYLGTINNYRLWLQNDSTYTGKVKYNKFFDLIEIEDRPIEDADELYIEAAAEDYFDHIVYPRNLQTAFKTYAYDHKYNPVIDYLEGLIGKWDGEERLETFIIKALDADDTPLVRFFSKTWMIGAVKRAFQPGCQFDAVLALQGGVQGSGKTNLIRCLCGKDSPLGRDCYQVFGHGEFGNKDSIDKMNKSWITLLDEFDKFDDNEVADLKSKITETKMSCRKAYGKNTADYPVHWIYAATTNADDFLCDLTGDEFERRYWIIECHKMTVDSRVKDIMNYEFVNQLWAEAVHYYMKDIYQKLFLGTDSELFEQYKKYQLKFKKTANRTEADYIYEILNKRYPDFADAKEFLDIYKQKDENSRYKLYNNGKLLNKIPTSYVRNVLKDVYHTDCKPKVIKSILKQLGNEWVCKPAVYNGRTISSVLVRVCAIDECADEIPIKYEYSVDNLKDEIPF